MVALRFHKKMNSRKQNAKGCVITVIPHSLNYKRASYVKELMHSCQRNGFMKG
jgi:hypothetical protein